MPAGVTEAKAALRQKIKGLPIPDWEKLIRQFLALPELDAARTVMLFYGVRGEPDTKGLITRLQQMGKRTVLPRCLSGRRLEGRLVTGLDALCPGVCGIPEPDETCPVVEREEIDLILVPNLCCDRRGFRLGHGAGYYDRYLAGYAGVTTALCPRERLLDEIPTDEFDIPMDLVITQTQIRREAEAPRRTLGERRCD